MGCRSRARGVFHPAPVQGGDPMLLRISDLPVEGVRIEKQLDPLKLKDLAALQEAQEYAFEGPLDVRLRVMPASGFFKVEGRVTGAVRTVCSRCLAPVELPVESAFRLTFARSAPGEDGEPPENRELEAEEMGLVPFEGDAIDFRDVIQEQVIMALPMQVLCRENCRGLCPGCGANLNTEACRCSRDDVDPRLAILKTLKRKS